MKEWTVEMLDGTTIREKCEIVTYDQAFNLIMANTQKVVQPGKEPGIELVRCINREAYAQYYPTPTEH